MSLADRLVLKPEFKVRTGRTVALDQAVDRIKIAFPDIEKRPPEDVSTIIEQVESAVRKGDWKGVTSGDVGVAIYAELEGNIIIPQGLRSFINREMQATTNPTLLDAICRGYLNGWEAGTKKTRDVSALLLEKANYLPERWKTLFSHCPDFLDAELGSDGVGARMVEIVSPFSWLKGIGLPSPHEEGFMRQAHIAFLRLTPEPRTAQVVDKLLSWATPPKQPELLDTRAAEVTVKILSLWLSEDCPPSLREHCVDRLVKRFGDPRKENQAFWSQVGEPHRRVMYKWLARKSMEAMFEIVTRSESGTEMGHQWAKRKRFWIGIYDQGRIDEAWVALGKKAIPYANELHMQTGDPSYQYYGYQTGRNDTCLLFMKIGNKTVVEGSHNFRVHIFHTQSSTAPVLYARNYNLDDILLPVGHNDAFTHDAAGNWMGKVQRRISR
jgi:hypothetical protein